MSEAPARNGWNWSRYGLSSPANSFDASGKSGTSAGSDAESVLQQIEGTFAAAGGTKLGVRAGLVGLVVAIYAGGRISGNKSLETRGSELSGT